MLLIDPPGDDRPGSLGSPPTVPGYVLESLLGRGASGEVWRAVPRGGGPPVAVKLLVAGDPARQSREAALLGELDHPHLVRLHEVVHQPRRGGAPRVALVLDLLPGGSLASLLARRGRLRPGEVVTAIAPVAAALAHAHDRGVVHGDLSPGNVVFTAEGRPVLTDLGVARVLGDDSAAEVTPAYVDPTVARGGAPGPASDVFGVAAAAFHALTGVAPWNAARPADVLAVAAAGELPDLDELAPEAPAELRAVIARGLAADPHLRGSAAAFALDLRHACRPEPVRLPVDGGTDGEQAATGRGPRTELTHQVPGRRPRPAPLVVEAGARRRWRRPPQHGAARGGRALPSAAVDAEAGRRWTFRSIRKGLTCVVTVALLGLVWAGISRQIGGPGGDAPGTRAGPDAAALPTGSPSAPPAGQPSIPRGGPATAPTTGPPSGSPTGPVPASVTASAEAAVDTPGTAAEWQALVDELYRMRARALTTFSTELLARVYADGSPHRVADEEYVAALAAAGGSLRGFAPQVVRVDEVIGAAEPGGGDADPGDRVELRVVDRWPGYSIVPTAGEDRSPPRAVPGRPATEVRMVLLAGEAGWRIERAERSG